MSESVCRLCGQLKSDGVAFAKWVKPTFTDWDKLQPGTIVCADCLFWLDEASITLAATVGKDKPQRMRNYSHFVVNGAWYPLSKGAKAQMQALLLGSPFPELAVIAESGQKHIVFRAKRNPQGGAAGWVQFELYRLWIDPAQLKGLLGIVEQLYAVFSKGEIESGDYNPFRVRQFGLDTWRVLEEQIKMWRGKPLLALALFLAQREDDERGTADDLSESGDGDPTGDLG